MAESDSTEQQSFNHWYDWTGNGGEWSPDPPHLQVDSRYEAIMVVLRTIVEFRFHHHHHYHHNTGPIRYIPGTSVKIYSLLAPYDIFPGLQ